MRSPAFAISAKTILHLFLFVALPLFLTAQKQYPPEIELVLQKTTNNRTELEKTIQHFAKKGDSLQLKAAYFLIANMDIHCSSDYYWAGSNGEPVPYNEWDYPDFDSSLRAFETIKRMTPGIHPVPILYNDINTIKAAFLIENIEMAFTSWKQPRAKGLSFNDFCEYLLPYRISVEPLQNWRAYYQQYFKNIRDSIQDKNISEAISYWTNDCHQWFTNTFNGEERNEPLPRLGALQLLRRKKGPCEDFAGLGVFEARALGIAATVEYVPEWATSSASHFFDVAFSAGHKNIPFEQLSADSVGVFRVVREPGKIVRFTYSKQPGVIAGLMAKENIPPNFLRTFNYKDVTQEYWETQDVTVSLFPPTAKKQVQGVSFIPSSPALEKEGNKDYVYACIFNTLDWRPIWWGTVTNHTTVFTNMSKGVVYLPMYYRGGRLLPAGYPVAAGYHHTLILQPDTLHTHTIHLPEQEKYLKYRPGKVYKLYYWDNRWKQSASQIATDTTTELVFTQVPQNALLLLVPEYTQKKERPFMITGEGERIWW